MINMKLRGKTLFVLLLVAVVPLVVSLTFLSNFTKDQIRTSMVQFAEKSSNFVERSTDSRQQELVINGFHRSFPDNCIQVETKYPAPPVSH